jgi:predicted lysophospholipase L1 biosynthesis ABC-type transport system permease subunit
MALGARRSEVMGIVLSQSAKLTIAGIVIGLIATAMGVRYLSGMLYGVEPFDQLTFIGVVVTFVIVTTLAAFVPARRATKVDPLVALRESSSRYPVASSQKKHLSFWRVFFLATGYWLLATSYQKRNCNPACTRRVPLTLVAWPKNGDVITPL